MAETRDFFETAPRMRGYRGDTFPVFCVQTDADDLTGCTMRLILEDVRNHGSIALTKACSEDTSVGTDGAGFTVQLVSTDTAALCGTYTMHFILTDTNGLEYRKLVGTLIVLDIPEEDAS